MKMPRRDLGFVLKVTSPLRGDSTLPAAISSRSKIVDISSVRRRAMQPTLSTDQSTLLLGQSLLLIVIWGCSGVEPATPGAEEIHPPQLATAPARVDEEVQSASPPPPEYHEDPQEPVYRCQVPPLPIPRPRECKRNRSYPECKWQIPHATLVQGRYRRWRNTIMEHWWGRDHLVSYVLAVADDFHRAHPEQVLAVGDLDAPGPRHQTHDNGVDVDLYLLGAMRFENTGGGRYLSNYEEKADEEIEALRSRVESLAKILAVCANGQLRIYYNDEVIIERFHTWYAKQNYPPNPFGLPMQAHNALHEFHFHVTILEDSPLLERMPLPEGQDDPIMRIESPPPPDSEPHLSSMSRTTRWSAVPRD